jgi:hypothetical protein
MIEHTDAGMQGSVAAPSIIFGTIAATIHGPAGGPWEAVHPAPPAKGNGAAINLDDIPDLSIGEDWHDDGRSQDYVDPDPISAEAYPPRSAAECRTHRARSFESSASSSAASPRPPRSSRISRKADGASQARRSLPGRVKTSLWH